MFRKIIDLIKGDVGFVYVGGSDLITAILGAIFWLYIASLLSIDEYGLVTFVISSSSLAFSLAAMGMGQTLLVFLSKRTVRFLYQIKSLIIITSVSSAVILGLVSKSYLVSILVIASLFYSLSAWELLARKKHKEYFFVGVGEKILQIGLSIAFYIMWGTFGFVLGYTIAYFVFSYRFFAGLKKIQLKFDELKPTWKFSFYNYGTNIMASLRSDWDKVIISAVFGNYLLGSYQFVFQLYMMLTLLTGSFFKYLLPYESEGTVKKEFKVIAVAFTGILVGVAVFIGPLVISSFYPKFVHIIDAFQIASIAIMPQILSVLLRVKILSENRETRHLLYAGILGSITYLSLLFALGSALGIEGMAMALLVSSMSEFGYLLFIRKGKVL
jgi:O-antigen/teichoic acid export membrane protein